jgi:hypothetical protein
MSPPLNNGMSMKSLDHSYPTEPHHPPRDVDGLMDDYVSMYPHWDAKEVSSSALASEHRSWLSKTLIRIITEVFRWREFLLLELRC